MFVKLFSKISSFIHHEFIFWSAISVLGVVFLSLFIVSLGQLNSAQKHEKEVSKSHSVVKGVSAERNMQSNDVTDKIKQIEEALGSLSSDYYNNFPLYQERSLEIPGKNLIRNSSFESADGSKPRQWEYTLESSSDNIEVSREGIRSGQYGLKMKGSSQTTNKTTNLGIAQQVTETVPGRTYTLSLYIKSVNVQSGTSIRFGFWDKYNNKYGTMREHVLSSTKDWYRIYTTVQTPGIITDTANWYPMIEVRNHQQGAVYIDDIQLEESSVLTIYDSSTAGGFSNSFSLTEGDGSALGSPTGNIFPAEDGIGSLGAEGHRWKNLFLSNATIDENGTMSLGGSATINGNLTVGNSAVFNDTVTYNGVVGFTGGITVGQNGAFTINNLGNITKILGISYSFPSAQGGSGQVLTNDGSGTLSWSTPSGGIDGTGNAGFLAYWTDGDSLASSSIFTDGSNFGIGTISPQYTFDVAGDIRAGTEIYRGSIALGGTAAASVLGANSGGFNYSTASSIQGILSSLDSAVSNLMIGNSGMWLDGGNYAYLNTAYTSGNIGNTASGGSNKISGLYLGNNAPIVFGPINNFDIRYDGTNLTLGDGINPFLSIGDSGTSGNFNFNNNQMYIRGDGFVGIGTISPQYTFDVAGNIRAVTEIYRGSIALGGTAGASVLGANSGGFNYSSASTIQGVLSNLDSAVNNVMIGSSGMWLDGGNYAYLNPSYTQGILGNTASGGTNKISGLYLGNTAPIVFGAGNNFDIRLSGTNLTLGDGTNPFLSIGDSGTTGNFNFNNNQFYIRGDGNVGIGTTNPTAKLQINGSSDRTQLIVRANSSQSNTNGLIQLQDSSGNALLEIHSDHTSNAFFGLDAGAANTATGGVFGTQNTFIGSSAGAANTTGFSNTVIGNEALYTNTIGANNVAVGRYSLHDNLSGELNVAMGPYALGSNSSGANNIGIGYNALTSNGIGNNNTVVGIEAGSGAGDDVSNNSFFGYQAGYNIDTNGNNNLLLGYQAGYNLSTGSNNIILGYGLSAPSATTSNFLNIGNLLFGSSINGTGNTISTGNIGIATTIPAYKLDVAGTARAWDIIVQDISLSSLSTSLINAQFGFNGYTNFSGGIGTGGNGKDSLVNAQRITSSGNLQNIGSYQGGEMSLTRGGTFATKVDYATGTNPQSVAIGDLNGDGKADLATANYDSNTISVFINSGTGAYAAKVDYATGNHPQSVAIGDLNGDGKADMAATNAGQSVISVFMNNGNGTFATKVDYSVVSSFAIAIGDVNGDGKADLAVTNQSGVSIFINNGDGTFATKVDYSAAGSSLEAVAIGDLNGDGKADVVANDQSLNLALVYINNGDGTFASKVGYAAGTSPQGISIGDVNSDGKADLLTVNFNSNTMSVFINNGDGTFATKVDYATGTGPYDVAMGDINGDGKVDISVPNYTDSTASVFINNGNGTFATKVDYSLGTNPTSIVMGDVNGDGKADMAATDSGSANVSVLMNNSSSVFYAQASTGYVGIGTTALNNKLEVAGGMIIGGTYTNITGLTAPSNGLLVQGNVGIGTTSPQYTFDVAGNIRAVTEIYRGSIALGGTAGASVLGANSGGFNYSSASTIQGVLSNLDSAVNNVMIGSSGMWLDGGNYAYLNPSYTQGILGNTASGGTNKISGLYLGNTAPIVFGAGNNFDIRLSGTNLTLGDGTNPFLSIGDSGTTGNFNFNNNQFYIRGDGNVGIGTSGPSYKLDIAGSARSWDIITHNISLSALSTSLINAQFGFNGYTNFSGGIGTGGIGNDSLTGAQRLTMYGNLTNIGSYQGGEVQLTSGGTFAAKADYTAGTAPLHVAVGDFNGDRRNDIVTANNSSNNISVLMNNGSGTFATRVNYATGAGPVGVEVGDLNGDGKVDIAATNGTDATISVFINNGNGTFATKVDYATGTAPRTVAIGDLNGDGKPDLAIATFSSNEISVLLNRGDGTFAAKVGYSTGSAANGVAIGDVNGDGKLDLVASYSSAVTIVSVLINNGNGTFASRVDYTTATTPQHVALADFNGDGKPDIVSSNQSSTSISVLMNNGDGTFATKADYATGINPQDVAVGDVTGDGKIDIVTANASAPSVSIFVNNGNGTFASKVDYTAGSGVLGVAIADFNADGKPDIVESNSSTSTVSVLLNNSRSLFYAQASTGYVGIGTTALNNKLEVAGGMIIGGTYTNITGLTTPSDGLLVQGNVGIGITNQSSKFAIGGLSSNTGTAMVIDSNGNVWRDSSSLRYKDDVTPFVADWTKIYNIDPVKYRFKGTNNYTIGYIAEELHAQGLYDLVVYDNQNRPDAIKYDRLSIYLLEALKDQKNQIQNMSSSLAFESAQSSEAISMRDFLMTQQTTLNDLDQKIGDLFQEVDDLKKKVEDTSKYDELTKRVATLEASLNTIQSTDSASLQIGQTNVLGAMTGRIETDELIVTGKTNLFDVGIVGDITAGQIRISGNDATIDSLATPLDIQSKSLADVRIQGGKVVIDRSGNIKTEGEITVKKVNIDVSKDESNSIGEGLLKKGDKEVVIETKSITPDSKIFVTSQIAVDLPLAVIKKVEGVSFTVGIKTATSEDIKFDWWVVN